MMDQVLHVGYGQTNCCSRLNGINYTLIASPLSYGPNWKRKGIKASGSMEFKLVPLDNLNPSTELINSLRKNQCLSKDLSQMGFTIVEASTRLPIAVSIEYQETQKFFMTD